MRVLKHPTPSSLVHPTRIPSNCISRHPVCCAVWNCYMYIDEAPEHAKESRNGWTEALDIIYDSLIALPLLSLLLRTSDPEACGHHIHSDHPGGDDVLAENVVWSHGAVRRIPIRNSDRDRVGCCRRILSTRRLDHRAEMVTRRFGGCCCMVISQVMKVQSAFLPRSVRHSLTTAKWTRPSM